MGLFNCGYQGENSPWYLVLLKKQAGSPPVF
jgi:hypothetical protein